MRRGEERPRLHEHPLDHAFRVLPDPVEGQFPDHRGLGDLIVLEIQDPTPDGLPGDGGADSLAGRPPNEVEARSGHDPVVPGADEAGAPEAYAQGLICGGGVEGPEDAAGENP